MHVWILERYCFIVLYTWVVYEEIIDGESHCGCCRHFWPTSTEQPSLKRIPRNKPVFQNERLHHLETYQPCWEFHSVINPRRQTNPATVEVRWLFIYGKHLVAGTVVSQQWIVQMPSSCFLGDHTSSTCWIMSFRWITMGFSDKM